MRAFVESASYITPSDVEARLSAIPPKPTEDACGVGGGAGAESAGGGPSEGPRWTAREIQLEIVRQVGDVLAHHLLALCMCVCMHTGGRPAMCRNACSAHHCVADHRVAVCTPGCVYVCMMS